MSIYRITKISYSKIGVNSLDQGHKVCYFPLIYIDHDEKGVNKSKIYLEQMVPDRKYYKNWIEGKTFIGGITSEGYDFFNEEGKLTGSIVIDVVGKIIQVYEDSIICLKDRTIYQIDTTGTITGNRVLSDEEMDQFGLSSKI